MTKINHIETLLSGMEAMSLEQAMTINLNERFDEKFVGQIGHLPLILSSLKNDFSVQSHQEKQLSLYQTIYWDTEALDFFNDHSKGRSKRSKIRKRNYADTNTCFLEIKKSINGKTFKTRVQSHFSPTFSTNDIEFLQLNDFDAGFFRPVLLIEYNRLVLWDKHLEGRITIDLLFKPSSEKKEKLFDNIYIFEIKGNRHFINRTIRKINFPISRHQTSFSKYCIGMIQINNLSRQKSRDLFGIYNQLVKTNNSV